jgi:hypothetical protein
LQRLVSTVLRVLRDEPGPEQGSTRQFPHRRSRHRAAWSRSGPPCLTRNAEAPSSAGTRHGVCTRRRFPSPKGSEGSKTTALGSHDARPLSHRAGANQSAPSCRWQGLADVGQCAHGRDAPESACSIGVSATARGSTILRWQHGCSPFYCACTRRGEEDPNLIAIRHGVIFGAGHSITTLWTPAAAT